MEMENAMKFLKEKLSKRDYQRLAALENSYLYQFIADFVKLCKPAKIFVCADTEEDFQYIREMALKNGEEKALAMKGHTIHFDNYDDQGRDRENTRILVPSGVVLDPTIRTQERTEGIKEIEALLDGIMKGRELFIMFFSLGPQNSIFTIPGVQLTDSSYVAHTESILYRPGYEVFRKLGNSNDFFRFVHSQGELNEDKTSKNLDKRRIFMDIESNTVYSINTQYGGNTIGLKKLAMRLAINKASKEGWLTEHMLIVGIHGPKNRVTYFTGAFPSLCGKTSTAMLDNETIIGDDIAYLRKINGKVYGVNVEKGIFGIIQGVNADDDPIIWQVLHSPVEIIFSNVLIGDDNKPYWTGMGTEIPNEGVNHSGRWFKGKKDKKGKEIPASHPNARFTVDLRNFKNLDPRLNDPNGVEIGGFIYGGRDSDTLLPIEEAFDWVHGIITKGASLESETTAATIGKEGVREFNPMSNMDFLSIPVGKYIQINLDFGAGLEKPPKIFGVNYFLRDKDGKFLNEKTDKKVWLKWAELRVHNEVGAIKTPTGLIPKYQDLRKLFKEVLNKDYSEDSYIKQFTVRVPENLAKVDRIEKIYRTQVKDTPEILFKVLDEQRQRLLTAREKYGDYIQPDKLA